jgi:DNA-binding response OmpR family regulator
MKSILLVDDEPVVSAGLQRTLYRFGFIVEVAETPEAAHAWIEKSQFDLILVEFDLSKSSERPSTGIYGTGLVRELRAARVNVPILMYTVLEGEWYETASLDAGADDFILKRTSKSTLLSRLYAHIRRHDRYMGKSPSSTRRVGIGRFVLYLEAHVLAADEKPIFLTVKETRLLEVLAASPGRIVPTQEILDKVWGNELQKSPAALRSAIKRLRKKLDENDVQDMIENVKGRGFKLAPDSLGETPSDGLLFRR